MAKLLDPLATYDRGLSDLDSLVGAERLVFMLQDFDNLMEMEGWDHYFLHKHHFAWYGEMKRWLHQIGAEGSLAVLNNYESHVRSKGFEVSPSDIESLLTSEDELDHRSCPDWRDQYCALREDRWEKAIAFLRDQGIILQSASPGSAHDRDGT
jgi:hypothetical protein